MIFEETFITEIFSNRYLVYMPSVPLAFVANPTLVNILNDIQNNSELSSTDGKHHPLLTQIKQLTGKQQQKSANGEYAFILNIPVGDRTELRPAEKGYGSQFDKTNTKSYKSDIQIIEKAVKKLSSRFLSQNLRKAKLIFDLYKISEVDIQFITSISTKLRKLGHELGIDLIAEAKLAHTADEHLLSQFSELFDRLRILAPDEILNSVDSLSPKKVASRLMGWQQFIRVMEEKQLVYDIEINVSSSNVHLLSGAVKAVCEKSNFEKIRINSDFLALESGSNPSSHTLRLLSEIEKSLSILSKYDKQLSFPGADIGHKTNFFGEHENEFTCLDSGILVSPNCVIRLHEEKDSRQEKLAPKAKSQIKPNYCQGCYAKYHCMGPNTKKYVKDGKKIIFRGVEHCFVVRELVKQKIIAEVEKSGGLVWSRH